MQSAPLFARLASVLVFVFICCVAGCGGGSSQGTVPVPPVVVAPPAAPTPSPSTSPSASPSPSPSPSVVSLSVTPATTTVARGTSRPLAVSAIMSDGTTVDVTASSSYTSSAPSTASVSSGGLVSGVALGSATITATFQQKNASSSITVTAATLTSLTVSPANSQVAVRRTLQFSATGTFTDQSTQDLTPQVVWTTNGPAATISTQGLATGTTSGVVTVTATAGAVSGSTGLTVTPAPTFSGTWTEWGPKPLFMSSQLTANVGGRITCILPIGVTTVLAGSASGGIWRTTDSGKSWTPRTDTLGSLAIGALARDPNHALTIVAGTGEPNFWDSSADSPSSSHGRTGIGLLQSTDGGLTWGLMPTTSIFARMSTSKVLFDPQDPTSQRIFVATCRATYGGTQQKFGLYLSGDGGQTFTPHSVGGANQLPLDKPVMDICFQPGNSQVVLATVALAGAKSGVWRSTDGGATWSATALVSNTYGRISLAAAPTIVAPTSGTFYALIGNANADTFDPQVYASNDNGVTWKAVCPTNSGTTYGSGVDINIMSQSGYDQAIAVDPNTASTIYIAGIEVCRVDGININAQTWSAGVRLTNGFYDATGNAIGGLATSPHVDVHALTFDASQSLWMGCDGGMWSVSNPSQVTAFPTLSWANLNANLATTQLNGLSLDPTATFGWGGFQDNGNGFYSHSLTWTQPSSGDGGAPIVESTNPSVQWLVYNAGAPTISNDNGVTFTTFGSGNVYNSSESSTFPSLPLIQTVDGTGTRIATARQSVYEVLPGAGDYVNASGGPLVTGNNVITSLAYAPSDPNVLYAGSSNGKAFVRKVKNGPFVDISAGLPGTVITAPFINGFTVDPNDPRAAWCTVAAFDVPHVMHTADQGATWTDVSGDLPDVPAQCIQALVLDNSTFAHQSILFVGTDSGVYFSQDGGAHWAVAGSGLPNVPVSNFYVNQAVGLLAAATYGRGAWTIGLDPAKPPALPAFHLTPALRPASRPAGTPLPPLRRAP